MFLLLEIYNHDVRLDRALLKGLNWFGLERSVSLFENCREKKLVSLCCLLDSSLILVLGYLN